MDRDADRPRPLRLRSFFAEDRTGVPAMLKPETLRQMTQPAVGTRAFRWMECFVRRKLLSFQWVRKISVHGHEAIAWTVVVNTCHAHSEMANESPQAIAGYRRTPDPQQQ